MSKTKIVIWGFVIVIAVFLFSYYMSGTYIDIVIRNFAKTKYIDDQISSGAIQVLLLSFFVFSIVSFYLNVDSLRKIGQLTVPQLFLQAIIDQAAIPVGIFIMVLHNNDRYDRTGFPPLSSLLNPLSTGVALLFKHVLLLAIGKRLQQKRGGN